MIDCCGSVHSYFQSISAINNATEGELSVILGGQYVSTEGPIYSK